MDCKSESASHYAGCPCNEEHWRERLAAAESRVLNVEVLNGELAIRLGETEDKLAAAESRASRLEAALREIESKTGHFGEAPPPPEWMPMLSLIAVVGRTARAALAEHRDAKGKEAGS